MTDVVAPASPLELRGELSRTLAQTRKWTELPRPLDVWRAAPARDAPAPGTIADTLG